MAKNLTNSECFAALATVISGGYNKKMAIISNLAEQPGGFKSELVPLLCNQVEQLVTQSMAMIAGDRRLAVSLLKDPKTLITALHTTWLWIFTACVNEKLEPAQSLAFMEAVLGYHGANTGIVFRHEFQQMLKVISLAPSRLPPLFKIYNFPLIRTKSEPSPEAVEKFFENMHQLAMPAHVAIFGTTSNQVEALRASVDEPVRVRNTQVAVILAILLMALVFSFIRYFQ